MARISKSVWIAAFAVSLAIHAAAALHFETPRPGSPELPAGPPVAIAASLASVIGGVPAVAATEAEPVSTLTAALQQTAQPDRLSALEPAQALQAPTSRDVEPRTLQEASPVVAVPAPPVANASAVSRAAKPEAIAAIAPPVIEPVVRANKPQTTAPPSVQPRRRKQKRSEHHKRKSAALPPGSSRQGAAGSSRGGRGGRSVASPGQIASYGARVRARILRQRPSASGRGRAVVSFAVTAGGGLRYARLARTSGNAALDRAALAAVRRAAPFPRPPAGAETRQLKFTIPFSFR